MYIITINTHIPKLIHTPTLKHIHILYTHRHLIHNYMSINSCKSCWANLKESAFACEFRNTHTHICMGVYVKIHVHMCLNQCASGMSDIAIQENINGTEWDGTK
jgi:hypothetical protein